MALTFRETNQDEARIAEYVAMLAIGESIPPIVVIDGETILDGHHRACAYAQAGIEPVTISLSAAQYVALVAAGYDDMEIAAAAHLAYGDGTGTDAIDAQFPGAGVYDRACAAAELL